MLAVVTCFFNPEGYRNPVRNFERFKRALDGVDLFTIELSYDGQFITDGVKLLAEGRQRLFQKERLLNILIASLPDKYDRVAWLDCDLLFENSNWLEEAEAKLRTLPVVQLYERVVYTLADLTPNPDRILWGAARSQDFFLKPLVQTPGGAWAARREVLEHGLPDTDIVGGSDAALLAAWTGDFTHRVFLMMNESWRRVSLAGSVKHYRRVKNRIGYVRGDAIHLYHGTEKNRRYDMRTHCLNVHSFNPETDLVIGQNGAWTWNTEKEALVDQVALYFARRNEDDDKQ